MILDEVRAAETELAQTKKDVWRKLVHSIFAGDELDAAGVARQLAELGKSSTDLQSAVELKRQRARWCKDLEHRETAAREAREIEAAIDSLAQERSEVWAQFSRRLDALRVQLQTRATVLNAGIFAREKLLETVDPILVGLIKRLRDRQGSIRARLAEMDRAMAIVEADDGGDTTRMEEIASGIEEVQADYAQVSRQLAEAESQVFLP